MKCEICRENERTGVAMCGACCQSMDRSRTLRKDESQLPLLVWAVRRAWKFAKRATPSASSPTLPPGWTISQIRDGVELRLRGHRVALYVRAQGVISWSEGSARPEAVEAFLVAIQNQPGRSHDTREAGAAFSRRAGDTP